MSQQSQANNLHERGVQAHEEARRTLLELNAAREAGQMTPEALAVLSAEHDGAFDEARRLLEAASRLNTIDRGTTRLSTLGALDDEEEDHRPEYLHPRSEGGAAESAGEGSPERIETTRHQGLSLGSAMTPEQLTRAARSAGIAPRNFRCTEGRVRNLLNRYLRHPRLRAQGREHQMVSPAGMEILFTGGGRPRVAEENAGYEGLDELGFSPYVDRDGGGIVGAEMRNEIIAHLRDRRHIRGLARVIPTTSGTVSFPTARLRVKLKKTKAHKGKVDGSPPVDIREFLGKTEFTPHGKLENVEIPEELLDDLVNFDLVGFLAEEIGMEAFEDEELEFLNGDGVSESFGVLPALAGTTQGIPHTGTGSADFLPEDLKTIPFEIREVHRANGIWMLNRVGLRRVVVMRTEDSGANTGQFLFQPGLRAGEPGTIGGYEVRESEFFPDNITSGSAGDPMMLFGDWGSYWIVDRLGLEIRVLDQIGATKGMVTYRFRKRLDGAPVRLESWVTLDRKS